MKRPKTKKQLHKRRADIVFWAIIISILSTVLYLLANAKGINRLSDVPIKELGVPYCNSTDPHQTMNIYLPNRSPDTVSPLLVFVHGGGWQFGDETGKLYDFYGSRLINQGVAVASIDYRLSKTNHFPDQNKDVACALTFLHKNQTKYRVNTKQMILFGDSAGGQLAAFASLKIPFAGYDYPAPIGVIDFYGVSNFTKIINSRHPDFFARRYLGSQYNTHASDASPTSLITEKAPPFLIVHGTADTTVPFSQSVDLYDTLIAHDVEAELVSISGAKHAFVGPELKFTESSKLIGAFDRFTKRLFKLD